MLSHEPELADFDRGRFEPPASNGISVKQLSIVMPCLNEILTIRDCVEEAITAMKNAGICGEVVIADNGSTDGSQELAALLGARVVDVSERGYGSAPGRLRHAGQSGRLGEGSCLGC